MRKVPFYSLKRLVPTKIYKETLSPELEEEYELFLVKRYLDGSPPRVGAP